MATQWTKMLEHDFTTETTSNLTGNETKVDVDMAAMREALRQTYDEMMKYGPMKSGPMSDEAKKKLKEVFTGIDPKFVYVKLDEPPPIKETGKLKPMVTIKPAVYIERFIMSMPLKCNYPLILQWRGNQMRLFCPACNYTTGWLDSGVGSLMLLIKGSDHDVE